LNLSQNHECPHELLDLAADVRGYYAREIQQPGSEALDYTQARVTAERSILKFDSS